MAVTGSREKQKTVPMNPNPLLLILVRSAASKQNPALQVSGFCLCLVVGSGDLVVREEFKSH
jgi:hypothetical protein